MHKSYFTLIITGLLLLAYSASQAQIPRTISYQGVLTDPSGNAKPDGNYSFTFRLYESATESAPIWSEQKPLTVTRGLFSTRLGDAAPFEASVKFDRPYWLSIQVDSDAELPERIPLNSVGYSFSAVRADTALVSLTTTGESAWRKTGDNIYRTEGRVGIGTNDPLTSIHIKYPGDFSGGIRIQGDANDLGLEMGTSNDGGWIQGKALDFAGSGTLLMNPGGGDVGVGTAPSDSRFQVYKNFAGIKNQHTVKFSMNDAGINDEVTFLSKGSQGGQGDIKFIDAVANGNSVFHVTGDGTTTTKILAITGGSDLAEPFEMTESEALPKGALVVIDPDNPGKLKLAREAYDKRVAGVISGAGGVKPGLTLQQDGVLEGEQHVALTGKVYALATALNGAIKPGDLLTTSDVPGHAMKAIDRERWSGAVIGKAMSALAEGEGLVLVLVNLQ